MNPDLQRLALLADPTRAALYQLVAGAEDPISRDQAAAALGIGRPLAAFHLDRLAAAGLLAVEYRRLSGKQGPGAGRPAKLYRRTAEALEVSVPPRSYRLLSTVLADAAINSANRKATHAAARRAGEAIGSRARQAAGSRPSRGRLLEAAASALAAEGFEPRLDHSGALRLTNCPFDAVAADRRPLICGELNRGLIEGIADGLGAGKLQASLEPQPGACCMVLRTA